MKQIAIKGMSCDHCQKSVAEALEEIGLKNVKVDLSSGTAVFSEINILETVVREAIEDAGFEVTSFA